ncbi:MAG: ribose-5-phosphate isomerase A [Candidatus Methylomirabilis sp.]
MRDPSAFEAAIISIPGLVGTGLFIGMADTVLVQDGEAVKVQRRDDR